MFFAGIVLLVFFLKRLLAWMDERGWGDMHRKRAHLSHPGQRVPGVIRASPSRRSSTSSK
jgi:hypothetical protein